MAGVLFMAGANLFSSPKHLDLFGSIPSLLSNGYLGFFSRPGLEVDHSPSSSAEITNAEVLPSLPHKSSWHSVYLFKHRENFPFLT
jgi:hypothetical protein